MSVSGPYYRRTTTPSSSLVSPWHPNTKPSPCMIRRCLRWCLPSKSSAHTWLVTTLRYSQTTKHFGIFWTSVLPFRHNRSGYWNSSGITIPWSTAQDFPIQQLMPCPLSWNSSPWWGSPHYCLIAWQSFKLHMPRTLKLPTSLPHCSMIRTVSILSNSKGTSFITNLVSLFLQHLPGAPHFSRNSTPLHLRATQDSYAPTSISRTISIGQVSKRMSSILWPSVKCANTLTMKPSNHQVHCSHSPFQPKYGSI